MPRLRPVPARRAPRALWSVLALTLLLGAGLPAPAAPPGAAAGAVNGAAGPDDLAVPRYDHIVVIVEENKDADAILGGRLAPRLAAYARLFGSATRFYGETHPSEGNYIALLGGDTFGVRDDDAFYCRPGPPSADCPGAGAPGYPAHTVRARSVGDLLTAAGLTWKGYYEDLPAPGSEAVWAAGGRPTESGASALYASKHSGFMNFARVQSAPDRARRIVGFDQLKADLARGALPNFALVVPNQCNEMHGLHGRDAPDDCRVVDQPALIGRGDAYAAALIEELMSTRAWTGKGNMAIIVTFDESGALREGGCCGASGGPGEAPGGGRIPTLVLTNHGPRGASDDTPYNHYSLLRTLEDAFRLSPYLGFSGRSDLGVRPMTPLFAVARSGAAR